MSAEALPPIPLGTVYGAMYMATLLVVGFWSVSVVQTFTYFWRYPSDHIALKALVGSMALVFAAQLGLILSGAWRTLIELFGDYTGLMAMPIMDLIEFVPQLYLTLAVQGFFVYRIVKLTGNFWLIAITWLLLALLQLVSGLMWVANAVKSPSVVSLVHNETWIPGAVSLFATAIVDAVLAVIMTYLLVNRMSQAAYRPSIKTLRRLLILSINSGSWTAAFAIIDIVLYWLYKDNMLYLIFDLPVGGMYFCTMLANLNARRSTARQDDDDYYVEHSKSGRSHGSSTRLGAGRGIGSGSTPKIPTRMEFVDPYGSTNTNHTEMSMFKPEP